jgi:hypothetical protein
MQHPHSKLCSISLFTDMKTASARTCLMFALAFALSSPAWAKRLQPVKSVLGDNEDIVMVINCPTPAAGDLYVAASAGGVLHFYHEDGGWRPDLPAPHEWGQTCSGSKQIILGNTRYIGAGSYSVYQVFTYPNAPDVYDTRNWVGGLNGLGKTRFQIKRPKQFSGDHDGDGWADDDKDRDGFHDDDFDCVGFHDDDIHRVGFKCGGPVSPPCPQPYPAYGYDIPAGHMPPPGECRIWFPDRPPGQQPPPGNCYHLQQQVPPGAFLVRG